MEEPIQNVEVSETKEPVKPEPATSPGDRAGAGSPTPECSICLGHLINTSFTDSCLHQFCFTCLLQWSKIKTECPLCKQTFKSIIHNVRSEEDYDQYHVPRDLPQPIAQPAFIPMAMEDLPQHPDWSPTTLRRFAYRAMAHRRFRLLANPTHDLAQRVPREVVSYRLRNPIDYRRNIYRRGSWSIAPTAAYADRLERSVEYFRQNPEEVDRLIPFINRDMNVLFSNNPHRQAYILRVVIDALTVYDLRSPEIRDLLRPYFGINTDHFLHELYTYARTGLEIPAYDSSVVYPEPTELQSRYIHLLQSPGRSSTRSSSSDDDSDVRVVDQVEGLRSQIPPAVGPHPIDMPGPSTVGLVLQMGATERSPTVLTISSNSSESECEVVGYVKPRHERTPEIIEIHSSEGEPWPSTSNADHAWLRDNSPSPTHYQSPSEEPSTSQQAARRNTRGARRKASMSYTNAAHAISDSSDDDDDTASDNWNKKRHHKRTRKTSKTCKKSPRKQSQKKDCSSVKKRNRRNSDSDDGSYAETKKWRASKKTPKSRERVETDSSSGDEENATRGDKKELVIKIRKDLMNQDDGKHTEDSSMSSSLSSSSASSDESDSCSSTSATNLPLKKRWSRQSHKKTESPSKKNKSAKKLKSGVNRLPVDSTILRKDSMKMEWYVEKKSPRSPSASDDENNERLRVPLNDQKEHKSSNDESGDEDNKHSTSQCSSRWERNQDKHRNEHKSKHKDKARDINEPSTSNDKHSEGKSPRKRHKTHKKHKSSKSKHSKGKSKRYKTHYSSDSSSSSN
uniref:E3 ubiquitin-protein ligase Topors n=1 Tax=Bracon brevicornis TaxID=1563983 RepID=A0A6V7LKF5_9HYME